MCLKGNQKSHQERYIDRYLTDEAVQKNLLNLMDNKALYKRQQAIVDHPFGQRMIYAMHSEGRLDIQTKEPHSGWLAKEAMGLYSYLIENYS